MESVFRLMADEEWGEYEKKDWVEQVGEKKMTAVLIVQVEQVRLCLFPRKSKFGWLFRVVRGDNPQGSPRSSPRSSPWGSPWGSPWSGDQWVVRRAGVSLFNSPVAVLHCLQVKVHRKEISFPVYWKGVFYLKKKR